MNENLDLVLTAIKNPNYKFTLLVFEKKEQEGNLLVLTTEWEESIKKNILDDNALIFVNEGNLLLVQKDSLKEEQKTSLLNLDNTKYSTQFLPISSNDAVDIVLKISN